MARVNLGWMRAMPTSQGVRCALARPALTERGIVARALSSLLPRNHKPLAWFLESDRKNRSTSLRFRLKVNEINDISWERIGQQRRTARREAVV